MLITGTSTSTEGSRTRKSSSQEEVLHTIPLSSLLRVCYNKRHHYCSDKDGGKSEEKPNYSDMTYWDDRYKTECDNAAHAANSTAIERSNSIDTTKDSGSMSLYEWYIEYDVFHKLFRRDLVMHRMPSSSSIMVAGCGNSSFCEDLFKNGSCENKNPHHHHTLPS